MSKTLQETLEFLDTCQAEPLALATAKALIAGYHHRWSNSGWTACGVENEYHLPIVNPDSGRSSRTLTQAGKMDGLAEYGGKKFLLEHKTASEAIDDPAAPYWRRLDIDAQVSHYVLAQWQHGQKLDGALYDVIRKPGIRPKLTKARVVETPAEFAERLLADTLERPEWYFQRKTIYRQDSQILEYSQELWEVAEEIRLARAGNRHYRNSGACMNWNRPCEFLPICSGHDTPDSDRWTKRESLHTELPVLENCLLTTKDILTHSRIACFKLCRRKHFYRYEMGIERRDKQEADALTFGTLFHQALAFWWGLQK